MAESLQMQELKRLCRTEEEQGRQDDREDSGGTEEEQTRQRNKKDSTRTGRQIELYDSIDIADIEEDSGDRGREQGNQDYAIVPTSSGGDSGDSSSEQAEEINENILLYFKYYYNLLLAPRNMFLTIWYSYMLLYFIKALDISHTTSGILIALGLLKSGIFRFWFKYVECTVDSHFEIGQLSGFVGLFFLFVPHPISKQDSTAVVFIYHFVFMGLFLYGCACLQLSHVLDIPHVNSSLHFKYHRFVFEDISKMLGYILAIIGFMIMKIFYTVPDRTYTHRFAYLPMAFIIFVAGVLFLILTKAKIYKMTHEETFAIGLNESHASRKITNMFKEPAENYITACLYVLPKVYLILNLIYLSMWISEREILTRTVATTDIPKSISVSQRSVTTVADVIDSFSWHDLAYVPIFIWGASILGTVLFRKIEDRYHHLKIYMTAFMVIMGNGFYIFYIQHSEHGVHLYVLAFMIGITTSLAKMASGSLLILIINSPVFYGGVSHQFMACADKVIAAIIVFFVAVMTCDEGPSCRFFYHQVLFGVSLTISLIGLVLVQTLCFIHFRNKRRRPVPL